jgi:hypothetical protein
MTLQTIAAEVDQIATNFSCMTLPELLDADLELKAFESALANEPPCPLVDVTKMKIGRILDALEGRQAIKRLHIREAEDRHFRSDRKRRMSLPQQAMADSHPEAADRTPAYMSSR